MLINHLYSSPTHFAQRAYSSYFCIDLIVKASWDVFHRQTGNQRCPQTPSTSSPPLLSACSSFLPPTAGSSHALQPWDDIFLPIPFHVISPSSSPYYTLYTVSRCPICYLLIMQFFIISALSFFSTSPLCRCGNWVAVWYGRLQRQHQIVNVNEYPSQNPLSPPCPHPPILFISHVCPFFSFFMTTSEGWSLFISGEFDLTFFIYIFINFINTLTGFIGAFILLPQLFASWLWFVLKHQEGQAVWVWVSELRRLGAGLPVCPPVCLYWFRCWDKLTWDHPSLHIRRPACQIPEAGWSMAGLSVRGRWTLGF